MDGQKKRFKLKASIKRDEGGNRQKSGLRFCKRRSVRLANGKTVQRGCGGLGLLEFGPGWRCLYCGNYEYRNCVDFDELWREFKLGREYWRISMICGEEYINGILAPGPADPLPKILVGDLSEIKRPKWFEFFAIFEERQFYKYVEAMYR